MSNEHHLDDDLLQRHFDGDLDSAEQAEARAHLADCAECNARLEQLGRLQLLIRSAVQDEADAASDASEVNWQGMFARIEQAAQEPEPVPVARVARVLTATSAARAKWFRPAVMSAAGAIAVAAAVLLTITRGPDVIPTDETYDDEADGTLARLEVSHSEITHVDFGPNAGQVFDIAFDDGSSTPVVWIDDDDDDDAEE
jgi:Putative zinc-finger